MLKQICIENVAIIKALQIDFNHGLIALTGETGAGKSLLLDAMLMVFSKKYASKEFLRQGETRGRVELTFDLRSHPQQTSIEALLQANGIDCTLGTEELLISRELSTSSSRSRVQGSVVPMDILTVCRGSPPS